MRVAVIGAGVVGLTTAHFLQLRGCEVTVIEAATGPAQYASHANGGQLSYSYTDAMADPSLLTKLPRVLLGLDPGLRLSAAPSMAFIRWGLAFLRNCTTARSRANSAQLLRLGLKSAELMPAFDKPAGFDFHHRRAGKLVLLPPGSSVDAHQRAALKRAAGCSTHVVSRADAEAIEPSLTGWRCDYDQATYTAEDDVGDARLFSEQMADWLGRRGVHLQFGTTVAAIEPLPGGNGIKLHYDDCSHPYDALVVCAGNGSNPLLQRLGINTQVYPVAGYSLSLPVTPDSVNTSITIADHKIVFSRLGQQVRIAGYADINLPIKAQAARVEQLLAQARQLAPDAADYASAEIQRWIGYRPMTPDSLPRTGPTHIPGLYLNLGHGMLGWTLCAATAEQVAGQLCGDLVGAGARMPVAC